MPADVSIPGITKCKFGNVAVLPNNPCWKWRIQATRSWFYSFWQGYWNHRTRSWHFNLKPIVNVPGPTSTNIKTKILSRVRIGLNKGERGTGFVFTRHTLKLVDSPNCSKCGKTQDVSDSRCECRKYEKQFSTLLI